jgi:hypothetical protein
VARSLATNRRLLSAVATLSVAVLRLLTVSRRLPSRARRAVTMREGLVTMTKDLLMMRKGLLAVTNGSLTLTDRLLVPPAGRAFSAKAHRCKYGCFDRAHHRSGISRKPWAPFSKEVA